MKTKNYRRWTSISFLAQLVITIIISMIVFSDDDILKLKENIELQLLIIVLFVSSFITVTAFILKNHITYENDRQIIEQEKYFKVMKLWTDVHELDEELQVQAMKQIKTATKNLESLVEDGKWKIEDLYQIDTAVKEFTIAATKTIKATHIKMNKWDEGINKKIFDENIAAIGRGVDITRIFILQDDELTNNDKDIKSQIAKHKKANINVLCVKASDLPAKLRKDFIIYDDKKVLVEEQMYGSDEYVSAEIIMESETVEIWKTKFDHIENQAMEPSLFFKQYF